MKTSIRSLAILLVFLISALPSAVFADAIKAGQVIASSGQVNARAADGTERRLKRQSPIHKGDTLLVGKNGFLQIRFTDGGLFSLRPDTELRIDDYHFEGKQDGNEKAVFNLVKGGLRAISDQIGKVHKENYQLHTPVATIGIRGTDYEVVLICKGTCSLAGYVFEGSIYATGDGGMIVVEQGQAKVYPGDGSAPYPITKEEFDQMVADADGGDGADGTDGTDGSTGTDPTTTSTDPVYTSTNTTGSSTVTTDGFGSLAPTGAATAIAGITTYGVYTDGGSEVLRQGLNGEEFYLNTVDGVGNVVTRATFKDVGDTMEFTRGTATLVEHGGEGTIGVNWGAWNSSWTLTTNGAAETVAGRAHYIYSNNVTTSMPNSGMATFSRIGGTTPTDAEGRLGTIGTHTMTVHFDTQTISGYTVSVDFDHGGFTRTFTGNFDGAAPIVNSMANFDIDATATDSAAVLGADCYSGCSGPGEGHASVSFVGAGALHAISSFAIPAVQGGYDIDSAVGTSLMKQDY